MLRLSSKGNFPLNIKKRGILHKSMEKLIKRGQVWLIEFPSPVPNSSVQGSRRPALVIQNNVGNKFSPSVTVVPLTTQIKKPNQPTHVVFDCRGSMAMACCEQIMTVDKFQFLTYWEDASFQTMEKIHMAIMIHLSLKGDKN